MYFPFGHIGSVTKGVVYVRNVLLVIVLMALLGGVGFCEELVEPASTGIGITPTWGWLVGPAAGKSDLEIPLPSFEMDGWVSLIVGVFVVPMVGAISIFLSLWIIMKALRMMTFSFSEKD